MSVRKKIIITVHQYAKQGDAPYGVAKRGDAPYGVDCPLMIAVLYTLVYPEGTALWP